MGSVPHYQIEARATDAAEWTRFPIILVTRSEAEDALSVLQTGIAHGWPQYRIVEVAVED